MDESATVITTEKGPLAVGVPEILPVAVAMDNPAGKPVADQLYAPVPPVAATVAVYAAPCVPLASVLVLITNGGAMVNEIVLVAVAIGVAESVTVIITGNGPLAEGVPEITPVAEAMDKPAGKPTADQL